MNVAFEIQGHKKTNSRVLENVVSNKIHAKLIKPCTRVRAYALTIH